MLRAPTMVLISAVCLAVAAPVAQADLQPINGPMASVGPMAIVRPDVTTASTDDLFDLFAPSGELDPSAQAMPVAPLADARQASGANQGQVLQMPPLPGSASLFLSALVSMGAWHLVRSVRHVRFDALPEWYHAGGPLQIGHAVPFDPYFDSTAITPVSFEPPACNRISIYQSNNERSIRLKTESYLIAADPRGPPTLSF